MQPESSLISLLNFGTLAIHWSATLNYLGNLVFFFLTYEDSVNFPSYLSDFIKMIFNSGLKVEVYLKMKNLSPFDKL